MKQEETRQLLLDGTIRVIAREGLDKATTKQIGLETKLNEVYIYRCFTDKEEMFAKAFAVLEKELVDELEKRLPMLELLDFSLEERCRMLYIAIWRFLLGNEDKCRCYVQYYYSPYFNKHSAEEHRTIFAPVIEKVSVGFREGANVRMLLNYCLNVLLDFSIKVYDGVIPDDSDTAEHVFRLLFAALQQYFKPKGENAP